MWIRNRLSFIFMSGLVAQKISMTKITRGDTLVPVTLLRIPQLSVAQIKTSEKDGYSALVLDAKNAKGKTVKRKEVPYDAASGMNVGDALTVTSLEGVVSVKLTSVSKGKGFTGAMKRWNFK